MYRAARTWEELLMRVGVWLVIIGVWGLLWCAVVPVASGAEPQFQVENRVPPAFEVVNKVAPQSAPVPNSPSADPYGYTDYRAFHAAVKSSGYGVLSVGVPDRWVGTYMFHCRVPSGFEGLADGEWSYFMSDGRMWRVQRVEVAAPRPFSRTPAVVVSDSTQITVVRSQVAGESNTSRVGAGRSPEVIYTLAPQGTLGGTWTSNCPTGVG